MGGFLQQRNEGLNSTSPSSKATVFTRSPTPSLRPSRSPRLTVYTAVISPRVEWQCWTAVRSVSSAPRQRRTAPSTASCCSRRERTARRRTPRNGTDRAASLLRCPPAIGRTSTSTTHPCLTARREGCPTRSVVKSS